MPTRRKPAPRDASGALRLLASFRSPERKPFTRLRFDPHDPDRILTIQGQDYRFPNRAVHLFALPTGAVLHAIDGRTDCGEAHFLRDGQILLAYHDYTLHQHLLRVSTWTPGADPQSVVTIVQSNSAERHLVALDPDERMLAVATGAGPSLRRVGAPWDELARVATPAVTSAMVALSPDTRHLLCTAFGGEFVHLVDRTTGAVLWTDHPFAGHRGGRAIMAIGFTPDGGHAVLCTTHCLYPPGEDTVFVRQLRLHNLADGARDRPALEAACADLHAHAIGPRGLWAVGNDPDGVTLLRTPDNLVLGAMATRDPVTALAFDADRGRLAAGTSRGELLLLELTDA